jgi:gliding motility-associated lipoprotein GldD
MRKLTKIKILLILSLILVFAGCRHAASPRPKGYFRIDLPTKEYRLFDDNTSSKSAFPFTFEYPVYGKMSFNGDYPDKQGWFNIEFPSYKAKIYMTYRDIHNDLDSLLEQTYKMNVKNHIAKADAIDEQMITSDSNKVYGVLYDLTGNTATAVQFYLTDSVKHYLRGSLYFDAVTNADSLEPVIKFFREDIVHLISTLKWKNNTIR